MATTDTSRAGWTRSSSVFRERVAQLRLLFVPPDPCSRTTYSPGELAQCDQWFPPVEIPVGHGRTGRLPVLVMVTGYSRVIAARMLPSRQAPDLICGHWHLLQRLGATPRALVWDNEAVVVSWRGGRPKLTAEFEALRGLLGIRVIQCRPRDPEAKGLVERAAGYLETSFLPGRSFTAAADFNAQLTSWLPTANGRHHRALGLPADGSVRHRPGRDAAAAADRTDPGLARDGAAAAGPLRPPARQRLLGSPVGGRPPREVTADLDTLTVCCASRVVAEHPRCWARHRTITDPAHRAAA